MTTARMMAGVPALNAGLYRTIGFLVGDPVVWIELDGEGRQEKHLVLRDIEVERAKEHSHATECWSPADFTPKGGLSGDRETATAQAAAEFFVRRNVHKVVVDRSLPMIFAKLLHDVGIEVQCDMDWGILERRVKSELEIERILYAQSVTEQVMERACSTIGNAAVGKDGALQFEGVALTSERVQSLIDIWLMELGFSNPTSIVAGGPIAADCHHHGHGTLYTSQPVIVDIFPRDKKTLYNGDCTRTVVNGEVPPLVVQVHATVAKAKQDAINAIKAGVTGEAVHEVTSQVMREAGYAMGMPPSDAPDSFIAMTHGTGHGLGLEVHEPPLLAAGGPPLVQGDVVTVEPGLYSKSFGGVRLEDMVVVEENGCRNLNKLHEGLCWKS